MKRILFLAIAFSLGAASFAQQSTLYIVNDSKGGGFAMRPLTLKVLDGSQELAAVKNHQIVKLDIAAGVHGLALKIASKDRTVLNAKPGETYFLRISVDQGFAAAGTRCVLMKPEEAAYWIPQAQSFVSATTTPGAAASPSTPAPAPPRQVVVSSDPSESLGNMALRVKQRKACMDLARDNPSVTCN